MRRPALLYAAYIKFRRLFHQRNHAALDQRMQRGAGHIQAANLLNKGSSLLLLEKSNDLLLISIELAAGFFEYWFLEYRYLHRAPRIARRGHILAGNPFFSQHQIQYLPVRSGGGTNRAFQRVIGHREVIE